MRAGSISRSVAVRLLVVLLFIPLLNGFIWSANQRRLEDMLYDHAIFMAKLLSPVCRNALAGNDTEFLVRSLSEAVVSADIVFGVILNGANEVVAFSDDRSTVGVQSDALSRRAAAVEDQLIQRFRYPVLGQTFIDVAQRLGSGGERLGVLRIGLKIPADREIGVQETIAAKLAKSFAIKCAALLRGNRSAELTALLADIRGRRDVVYALIVGNNGRTLAASANNYAGVRIPADPEPTALVGAMVGADATLSTYVDEVIGKEILEVATPFKLHVGRSGGTIRLGLSTDSFTGLDRRIGVLVGLMTVSLMALVALVARGVRREIAVPIDRLIADTAAIAMGRLDKPVAVTQEGEIGQLATAFESMRVSLQHRVKEIATRAMAMEGELGLFALPDLIQMIASSEQSGVLELSNGSSRGQVVIVNGDIAHAVLGQAQGVSAIEEMFAWDDGQFKFTPTVYTGPRTITKSWQELLVDSARRLDEARRAKEMFPNPDMQLCGSRTPSEETIFRLTVDESRVLALVAGGATVRSVVLEAELGEPETYAILRRLVLVGLIEVVAVPASEEA